MLSALDDAIGRVMDKVREHSMEEDTLREGNWKLVKSRGKSAMLFDLSNDIGEQKDLAKTNPKLLRKLQTDFSSWEKQMESPRWIRQDRNNAEVGGQLKNAKISSAQDPDARLERLFK